MPADCRYATYYLICQLIKVCPGSFVAILLIARIYSLLYCEVHFLSKLMCYLFPYFFICTQKMSTSFSLASYKPLNKVVFNSEHSRPGVTPTIQNRLNRTVNLSSSCSVFLNASKYLDIRVWHAPYYQEIHADLTVRGNLVFCNQSTYPVVANGNSLLWSPRVKEVFFKIRKGSLFCLTANVWSPVGWIAAQKIFPIRCKLTHLLNRSLRYIPGYRNSGFCHVSPVCSLIGKMFSVELWNKVILRRVCDPKIAS